MDAKTITFTESEIKEMQGYPMALRALAEIHLCKETMADGMDMLDSADWHAKRAKELQDAADAIQAGG